MAGANQCNEINIVVPNINDIDVGPSASMAALNVKRQQALLRLQNDGTLNTANSELATIIADAGGKLIKIPKNELDRPKLYAWMINLNKYFRDPTSTQIKQKTVQ